MAVDDDHRRRVRPAAEGSEGLVEGRDVVGVRHVLDVPAIGPEARADIVAERQVGMAFDGDVVVVVDPAQVAELQMAGKRGRFVGNAFHHVAVAAHRIDVVVEEVEAGAIEVLSQPARCDRHADAVAAALSQRPGGRLDADGQPIFGVARTFAVELAEQLDIVEAHRRPVLGLHAGKMQQGIEQHRGVAVRQNEAVAVGPRRLFRIVAQELLPQGVGHRRQGHGRAGMTGVGFLHRIHGEGADGVDAQLVEIDFLRRRCADLRGVLRGKGHDNLDVYSGS